MTQSALKAHIIFLWKSKSVLINLKIYKLNLKNPPKNNLSLINKKITFFQINRLIYYKMDQSL